jgi:hypothetical protein
MTIRHFETHATSRWLGCLVTFELSGTNRDADLKNAHGSEHDPDAFDIAFVASGFVDVAARSVRGIEANSSPRRRNDDEVYGGFVPCAPRRGACAYHHVVIVGHRSLPASTRAGGVTYHTPLVRDDSAFERIRGAVDAKPALDSNIV